MNQRPASAALDLGLQPGNGVGIVDPLLNETEEQKRKRLQGMSLQQDGAMAIISPAVQSLLGRGLNG